jgi:uncharacterized protein with FMN-binding domain
LAVYSAGNLRTREAAQRFDDESGARRRPSDASRDRGPATTTEHGLPSSDPAAGTGGLSSAATADAGGKAAGLPSSASGAPVAAPAASPGSVSVNAASASAIPAAATTASATPIAAPIATASATAKAAATAAAASPTGAVSGGVSSGSPTTTAPLPATAATPAATPSPTTSTTTADTTKPATDSVKVLWRDGTYSGWGTSRHGDIEATVVIEGGKITGASISRCLTRYSCSWIAHLQQQVVTRQSPDVDYVSGATQSANAFYYAVVDALQKAK